MSDETVQRESEYGLQKARDAAAKMPGILEQALEASQAIALYVEQMGALEAAKEEAEAEIARLTTRIDNLVADAAKAREVLNGLQDDTAQAEKTRDEAVAAARWSRQPRSSTKRRSRRTGNRMNLTRRCCRGAPRSTVNWLPSRRARPRLRTKRQRPKADYRLQNHV